MNNQLLRNPRRDLNLVRPLCAGTRLRTRKHTWTENCGKKSETSGSLYGTRFYATQFGEGEKHRYAPCP